MSFIKRLASYAGVDVLAAMLGLVTSPITTRLLSIEQYGAISYISAVWVPFMVARYAGAGSSFVLFRARGAICQDALVASCTKIVCVFSVLVVFAFFTFVSYSNIFSAVSVVGRYEIFIFSLGLIPVALVDWVLLILRFSHKAYIYAKVSIIQKVVVVIAVLPFMYLVEQESRLMVYFSVVFLVSLVSLVYAVHVSNAMALNIFSMRNSSWSLIKDLLSYGIYLVPGAIVYSFVSVVDKLLLGGIGGVDDVALLALATALSAPVVMLKKWTSLVLGPMIVEWVRHLDQSQYSHNLDALLQSLSVIFFPVVLIITIWIKPFVVFLYPESYSLSAILVPVLAFSGVLAVLTLVAISTLLISQNKSATLKINLLALMANILLALYLIPLYGPIGAALGTVLAEFIILVCWALVGTVLHKNLVLNWMRILPVIVVVFLLVLMGAFHFYQDVGFLQRILASVLCLGLSATYLWFNSRNLKIVKQLL